MGTLSETRTYRYIYDQLKAKGWDTSNPDKNGVVYEQHEAHRNSKLKTALSGRVPDCVVKVDSDVFWVIEAKASPGDIGKAVSQAQGVADVANSSGVLCPVVSGVAGSDDTTRYVETRVLVDGAWQPHTINGRVSTGFLTRGQILSALASGGADSSDFQLGDFEFVSATSRINELLHSGSINKRNRAGVLA